MTVASKMSAPTRNVPPPEGAVTATGCALAFHRMLGSLQEFALAEILRVLELVLHVELARPAPATHYTPVGCKTESVRL